MNDDEYDDVRDLRSLDPARGRGAGDGPAAQVLLTRVLDAPRVGSADGAARRAGRRDRRALWAVGAGVAATVAAALLVVQPWSTPPAFATWTPVPEQVDASALDNFADQCAPGSDSDQSSAEVIVAEERGRVTFVVELTAVNLRHCLFVDGGFHSSGLANLLSQPGEIAPTEVQSFLAVGSGVGEQAHTSIVGRVGEDVVAVEVHPRETVVAPGAVPAAGVPEVVTATIGDGYYGAWWPGRTEEFELTIHLADGTVVPNVPAFDDAAGS